VLGWIGVKLELNFIPIHSNTCGLRGIRQHPNMAEADIFVLIRYEIFKRVDVFMLKKKEESMYIIQARAAYK